MGKLRRIPPRKVRATYRNPGLPIYEGNPFIEALPEILSDGDAAFLMTNLPKMDEQYRLLPNETRAHMIYDVVQLFQPLDVHLDLQRRVSITIRAGYRGRNPTDKDYFLMMEDDLETLESAAEKEEDEENGAEDKGHKIRSTASGFYMVGFSGVGKTRAFDSILELNPQVIYHSEYKGHPLCRIQVVWLKITCPHDGSLRGLCLDFMQSLDDLVGTNYYAEYKGEKNTTDILLGAMRRIAHIHGIGLLVIDEIQQLSVAKGQGDTQMLNFFVDLVNRAGMPIVLIGTPKALRILDKEFQQARRASGMGDKKWFPMRNDEEWFFIMESLFKYQYIRRPVKFTKELADALWNISAGIMDFAIKGFVLAQFRAMDTGDETITTDIIYSVAKDYFSFANDAITKLLKHKYDELTDIPDIDLFDLEQHYQDYYGKAGRQGAEELAGNNVPTSTKGEEKNSQPVNEPNPSTAQVVQTPPETKPRRPRVQPKKDVSITDLKEDDLRRVLAEASDKGHLPNEALKNSGYIRPIV